MWHTLDLTDLVRKLRSNINYGITNEEAKQRLEKYGKNKIEYTEIILLKKRFGTIYGYIVDDDRNYEQLQLVMKKNPLRLKGFISDNRYFTGLWYHPIETYRYHGSFQLLIEPNYIKMNGQWIGYSESKQIINNGIWTWDKLE